MKGKRTGRRLRYILDRLLVRNPLWQLMILILLSALAVTLGMILIQHHVRGEDGEPPFWWSLTRLMDQGTFIDDYREDAHTRLVGILLTLCGVLVMSTLIGTVSSKINARLDRLRRGRSPVEEKEHLIVCGSGDRLYEIARELLVAAADEPRMRRSPVVLFSGTTREEMEETLGQRIRGRHPVHVACRTGESTDIDSLRIAGFDRCRGFVITGEDDTETLKSLIAAGALCEGNRPVAVCEVHGGRMGAIATAALPDVIWVPVREVVMRLLIQICRQPGLSAVYQEILSFTGNEFYFLECPEVTGRRFGEAAALFRRGVAVGLEHGERLKVNPPLDAEILPGDRLLVLAENPESIAFEAAPRTLVADAVEKSSNGEPFEMLVLSGHSRSFSLMLELLGRYSHAGAHMMAAGSLPVEEGAAVVARASCPDCTVEYARVDRTDPDALRALEPWKYDSVMLLSGKKPGETDERADSECMVALLILKEMRRTSGEAWKGTVVAEIRNPRNRRLVSAAEIDDFVISNEICSMIMAQLVRQSGLRGVFEELFDPSGCEIQLRCPSQYRRGTFAGLEAQGRGRGEIVLGWITGRGSDAEVVLNPDRETPMPQGDDCRIVAIAERS